MAKFLDRGQTTDGYDIQIRVPGPGDGGWYLVTVDDSDGDLITISCSDMSEAEEAARWMAQYDSYEIADRMQRLRPHHGKGR
jgi:hypothetical protein